MFKLINEISDFITERDYLLEAVKEVFAEEITELFEGADHYIGKAIAMLNAGKNPFEGDRPAVDPQVVASLILLSDPDNRDAFNFTPAKFAIVDTVDKNENVRKFLSHKVGMSNSGQNATNRIVKMAAENPKAVARELQKVQILYSQAMHQHQQAQAA